MDTLKKTSKLKSVAVIGNYLPRRCGIATFTADLCEALTAELGAGIDVSVVAMDDNDEGYKYPRRVKFQLRENKMAEYLQAADFLNVHQYDIAILQHEFGIFGGENGSHILMLIKNLNMPVITILHTVLEKPTEEQRAIIMGLAKHSETLVVMSNHGASILREIYAVPESKIAFIHHGIPDLGFEDPCFHKETFGVEDRKLILSFGLMHPGKGFEYAIKALPEIVKKHPEVSYLIVGATHPNILRDTGDAYRQSLHQLVNRLELKNHVQFINKFVELGNLCQYINAADIYITPYLNPDQIVSGTLAYTVGAGKAVISTPYLYAKELLADNRGIIVGFKDHIAITKEVINLLDNDNARNAMRRRSYKFGRSMIWKEVARKYMSTAAEALERLRGKPKVKFADSPVPGSVDEHPEPKLDHLMVLTDDVGILEHANYTVPIRTHGYCTDDNSRALIVTSLYHTIFKDASVIPMTQKYLAFILHAFNTANRHFRNRMSYQRQWMDEVGSEDSHGRALWGLGVAVKHAPLHPDDSLRHMAMQLFASGLDVMDKFISPRALAFALVGLHYYLEVYSGDARAREIRSLLANKLHNMFKKNMNDDWPWCEDIATYSNAKLPHALILSGQGMQNKEIYDTGVKVLRWLVDIQTSREGHLSIIGNSHWFKRNGKPSSFDQQPVEAMNIIDACVEVYRSTGDAIWLEDAHRAMNWFLGHNDLNAPLYDFKTGGCSDGLQPHGTNENKGAESTLSALISMLIMQGVLGQEVLTYNSQKI